LRKYTRVAKLVDARQLEGLVLATAWQFESALGYFTGVQVFFNLGSGFFMP
jgi:hypothetical protein